MDVPDTDFAVTLYEILPDGSSVQLTGDAYACALSRVPAAKPSWLRLARSRALTSMALPGFRGGCRRAAACDWF